MALAYAFFDESGVRHGEPNADPPDREFSYVPASGPFAGQQLIVHASSWEGSPSGTWLRVTERWGCFATTEVEEILAMGRHVGDPRAG